MRSSYRVSSHLLVVIEDLSPPFFYYFFCLPLSVSISLSSSLLSPVYFLIFLSSKPSEAWNPHHSLCSTRFSFARLKFM